MNIFLIDDLLEYVSMDVGQFAEGYVDGLDSVLSDLPMGSGKSESYRSGWINGRDDRSCLPQVSYTEPRPTATMIADRDGVGHGA